MSMLTSEDINLLFSLPDVNLFDHAQRLSKDGNLDLSMKIYKILEKLCRQSADDAGLANSLYQQSVILITRDELAQAEIIAKEAHDICLKNNLPLTNDVIEIIQFAAQKKKEISSSFQRLFDQVLEYEKTQNYTEALACLIEMEQQARRMSIVSELIRSLGTQAAILSLDLNKKEDAYPLAFEAFNLLPKLPDFPARSHFVISTLRLLEAIEITIPMDQKVGILGRVFKARQYSDGGGLQDRMPPPSELVQKTLLEAIIHYNEANPHLSVNVLTDRFYQLLTLSPSTDLLYLIIALINLELVPFLINKEDLWSKVRIVRMDPPPINEPAWLLELWSLIKRDTSRPEITELDQQKSREVARLSQLFLGQADAQQVDKAYATLLEMMSSGLSPYVKNPRIQAEIAEIDDYNKGLLTYAFSLANNYRRFDEAVHFARLSLEKFEKTGDRRGEIDALHVLARIDHERGDLETALAKYSEVLAFSQKVEYEEGCARAFHEMGRIYTEKGPYNKAEECLREGLAYYARKVDRANLKASLDTIATLTEYALALQIPAYFDTVEKGSIPFGNDEDYLDIRALALRAEFHETDHNFSRRRLVQKAMVALQEGETDLAHFALQEAKRTAALRDDIHTEKLVDILYQYHSRQYSLVQVEPTLQLSFPKHSLPFNSPDSAANTIAELIEALQKDEANGSRYIYRGQTRGYPGPLFPSMYRGVLNDSDYFGDDSHDYFRYALRKCGRKFYGEYNRKFLRQIESLFEDVPPESLEKVRSVYTESLRSTAVFFDQMYKPSQEKRVLSWYDALQSSLSDDERKIYHQYQDRWRPFIDNYHRRMVRMFGFFKPFGYLLGTALAQQYGFKSEGLDATTSLKVAAFFATHRSEDEYSLLEQEGIGVIYRFPYPQNDVRYRKVRDYSYYTLPSIVELKDVIYRFEAKGLAEDDVMRYFDYYYGANHLDGLYDIDLLALPEGILTASRVARQEAVIILPDEFRKDRQDARPGVDGITLPEFQFIEDLASRDGVEKFYFKHTGMIPDSLRLTREYLWPRDDPLLKIVVGIITAIYRLGAFKEHMIAHRLDLIDAAYNKEEFLKLCERFASQFQIRLYDHQSEAAASVGAIPMIAE